MLSELSDEMMMMMIMTTMSDEELSATHDGPCVCGQALECPTTHKKQELRLTQEGFLLRWALGAGCALCNKMLCKMTLSLYDRIGVLSKFVLARRFASLACLP